MPVVVVDGAVEVVVLVVVDVAVVSVTTYVDVAIGVVGGGVTVLVVVCGAAVLVAVGDVVGGSVWGYGVVQGTLSTTPFLAGVVVRAP